MKRGSINCDELWRIWYVILNSILHGFLFYVGLTRYLSFKSLVFDPKYGDNWSHFGLNFYMGLTIAASVNYVFFLYACLMKTNNFANEGVQIGRDTDNLMFLLNEEDMNGSHQEYGQFHSDIENSVAKPGKFFISDTINNSTWNNKSYTWKKPATLKSNLTILFRRFKRNFLPYSSVLHILIAFCLYLPLPVFEAQQIYHRAISENYIWNNDLSLIFRHDLNHPHMPGHKSDLASIVTTDEETEPTINNPVITTTNSMSTEQLMLNIIASPSPISPRPMSPEFFNILFALLLLCMRYPAVFWYTNKIFAFFFAVLLIVSGFQILLELCVVSVLVKMAINSNLIDYTSRGQQIKVTLVSIIEKQQNLQTENINIHSLSYILLSVFGSLLMLISFYTVFEYGNRQFSANMLAYRQYLSTQGGNLNGYSTLVGQPKLEIQTGPCSCCFHVYTPHIFAMILTIFVILVKTPIFLATLEVYRHTGSYLMLSGMMSTCLYLFIWLAAWFAFRLKPAWQFKVNLPIQPTGHLTGNDEQVTSQYDPVLMQLNSSTLPRMSRISFARQNSISGGISTYGNNNNGSGYFPTLQIPHSQSGSLNRQHLSTVLDNGCPIYSCFHDEAGRKKMMTRNSDDFMNDDIYVAHKDPQDTFNSARFLSGTNPKNLYGSEDVYTKHHFQQTIHPLSTNLINQTASITGSGSNASSSLVTAVPNCHSRDDSDLFMSTNQLVSCNTNGDQSFGPNLSIYRPHNLSLSNTSVKISDNYFERSNASNILTLGGRIKKNSVKKNGKTNQDCSPNSSEPGSHNTISSDSGIDNKKNKANEIFPLINSETNPEQTFIGLTDNISNEIPPPLKLLEKSYFNSNHNNNISNTDGKSMEDLEQITLKDDRLYSQV